MAEIIKPDYSNLWASGGAVIAPSVAKIQVGWTAEIPPHQWENWSQNRQDTAIAYLFQRGIAEWDATTEYWAGKSAVIYQGNIYIAMTNNTNSNPSLVTSAWQQVTGKDPLSPLSGLVAYFATNTAPEGWLKANGGAVSRTVYANLFAKIGTTFGAGDGSTTFNLPDLRGEFIRGWDDGRGIDIGRVFGSFQADMLKSHSHALTGYGRIQFDNTGGHLFHGMDTPAPGTAASLDFPSSGGGAETRPRNIALLACIKI